MSTPSDLPSLSTYVEILVDVIDNWSTCKPWAVPMWAVEVIFYACLLMFLLYIYVLINIVRITRRNSANKNPFYNFAFVLAIGDIITLIMCSREAVAQSCALKFITPRHYAWETVGVFCVDLIYTVNLFMAIYRFNAMLRIGKATQQLISMNIMLVVAVLWAVAMAVCSFFGLIKNISFPNDHYSSYFHEPFSYLRTPIQMGQLALTLILYIAAFVQLRLMTVNRSLSNFHKEYRFLIMASLIFLCELIYFYCTDWIGSRIFHLGSDEFNANLNAVMRPITIFYVMFSAELRRACFHPFSSSTVGVTTIHTIVCKKGRCETRSDNENQQMIWESPYEFRTNAEKCIYTYVMEALRKYTDETPNRKVLISAENPSNCHTFAQLLDQIKAVEVFLDNIEFGNGQVATVVMPSNIEIIPFYLAVLGRGGIYSGMSPMLTDFEIHRQLSDNGTSVIFTTNELLNKVTTATTKMNNNVTILLLGDKSSTVDSIAWSDVVRTKGVPRTHVNNINDVAVLPYSSGTTGMPKGVMLSHYNMMSAVLNMIKHADEHIPKPYNSTKTIWSQFQILSMPLYHISGKFIILGHLITGSTTVILNKFDLRVYLETIQNFKIWNMMLSPPVLLQLVKDPLVEKHDLSSLGFVTCGAAPLGSDLAEEFIKKFPNVTLTQIYAMSECLHPFLAFCDKKDNYSTGGCVSPGYQAKIVDLDSGNALGPNERGELLIKGPSVMKGYFNRPEATRETLDEDGWLHTGDIGYINNNGELFVVDRKKEMIKVNGLQVAPAEIESVLASDPRIKDVGVVGLPNPRNGEVPGAFVVKNDPELNERDVQKLIKERIAEFKWPEGVVVFVDKIPKLPSGKILRRQLRQLVA